MRPTPFLIAAVLVSLVPAWAGPSKDPVRNPFAEMEALEKASDLGKAEDLWRLAQEAGKRTLHGTARKYARRLVRLEKGHKEARALLGQQEFEGEWLNPFELGLRKKGMFRHVDYGWFPAADREKVEQGLLPVGEGPKRKYVPVAELEAQHATWKTAWEIDSAFYRIKSTAPLAVLWYLADDCDAITRDAYRDLFEIEDLPKQRMTCHLYGNAKDVVSGGGRLDVLQAYGAYYTGGILHVLFSDMTYLTALRHEVAHALNAIYSPGLPQCLEEGIGPLFQFTNIVTDPEAEEGSGNVEYTFDVLVGVHDFAMDYVRQVQGGKPDRIKDFPAHVATSAHWYSMYRSLTAFFLYGEDRRYRMGLIQALFRKGAKGGPSIQGITAGRDVQEEWTRYVQGLKPAEEFTMVADIPRTQRMEKILAELKASRK